MNILYLAVLGILIGSALFLIEPKKQKSLLFSNIFLGILGAVLGGIYAQVFFGIEFSRFGLSGLLLVLFTSVLFWFLGRIIRQMKS